LYYFLNSNNTDIGIIRFVGVARNLFGAISIAQIANGNLT